MYDSLTLTLKEIEPQNQEEKQNKTLVEKIKAFFTESKDNKEEEKETLTLYFNNFKEKNERYQKLLAEVISKIDDKILKTKLATAQKRQAELKQEKEECEKIKKEIEKYQ